MESLVVSQDRISFVCYLIILDPYSTIIYTVVPYMPFDTCICIMFMSPMSYE